MTNQEHIVQVFSLSLPFFLFAIVLLFLSRNSQIPLLTNISKLTAIFAVTVMPLLFGLSELAFATCTGSGGYIGYSECALMPIAVAQFLFSASLSGQVLFMTWVVLLALGGAVAEYRSRC
jgi:hypothetical protein